MEYLKKAKETFFSLGLQEHYPCTQEEVLFFERTLEFKLPQAFTEYLLFMGHGAENMMQGSDFFYRPLFDLQEGVDEIFEQNPGHPILPKDAIVFFMHAGSRFMFICASQGDDPPVYFYREGIIQFQQIAPSFSQYLETEFRNYVRLIEWVNSI